MKFIKCVFNHIEKDNIDGISAQCAYYTILSFIPFIILILTLIQYTTITPQVLFDNISKVVPKNMQEIILGIIQEVYSKSIGTISISIVFTILSAGKGLFALTKGINMVYNIDNKISKSYIYLRLKTLIETVFFIIIIMLGLLTSIFGNRIEAVMFNYFGTLRHYDVIYIIISKIVLLVVTIFIFLIIYKFIPNSKVKLKAQIVGALVGASLLNIISFIFSRFLDIFKNFSLTYGSLTTLILVMMWTYTCFYTIFLGAEINKLINKKEEGD